VQLAVRQDGHAIGGSASGMTFGNFYSSTPRLNDPSEWLGRAGKVGQALGMVMLSTFARSV